MTRRHSPPLDGALAKAASGALEHVPVALAQNLARALAELKELGCLVVGLDDDATDAIETLDWPVHTVLVLGAEGRGLRLTRESCDRLARIATEARSPASTSPTPPPSPLHLAAMQRLGLGRPDAPALVADGGPPAA
jgi:23S rRNA (guanosine2251-2'-O)-methyltransferase